MDQLAGALATLRPEDLFPMWCFVDSLQQRGELSTGAAIRWKHGIYGLMVLWDLEPDDVLELMSHVLQGHPAEIPKWHDIEGCEGRLTSACDTANSG